MSEENVEIVRQMYEAYLTGDVESGARALLPGRCGDFSIRGDRGPPTGREA